MEKPLISVIMPCFNMEKYISDTITSVKQQTYSHWELLVVDDLSEDSTPSIVETFCHNDERIHFEKMGIHTGIANSRNTAIRMSKGRYLAFLDADDIWHPEKLEQQLAFMQQRQVGFCYTAYDLIDEGGKPLNKTIRTAGDLNYDAYLRNTIIGCSTVMVDTAIVGEVVVPNYRTSEDTATWLDILKKGFKAYAIEKPLTSYKVRSKSASSNKLKAAADLWRVYRQHEKLSLPKAVVSFLSYVFHAIVKRLF